MTVEQGLVVIFTIDKSSSHQRHPLSAAFCRVVGTWAEVKEECFRSRYQPVLLLYQLNQVLESTTYATTAQNTSSIHYEFVLIPPATHPHN